MCACFVQNNRMDANEEYVEDYLPYDDDDDYRPPKRPGAKQPKQPPKLRRYKDDTYRCVVLCCWHPGIIFVACMPGD